jgi:hypothetical protein
VKGVDARQPYGRRTAGGVVRSNRGQNELEQRVREALAGDCDRELGGVREVERSLAPGLMPLLEHHLLGAAVQCAPFLHATLQRPWLPVTVRVAMPSAQRVDHRRRLQHPAGVRRQNDGHDLC